MNIEVNGRYGIDWNHLGKFDPRLVNDPFIQELFLYRWDEHREQANSGSKWGHMANAIRMKYDDNKFAWHKWVDRIGEEWCENDSLVVWGPSSTAKSATNAMIHLIDYLSAPYETYTLVITNKMKQHPKRFWGAFTKWYGMLPDAYKVGKFSQEPLALFSQKDILPQNGEVLRMRVGDTRGFECKSMQAGDAEQNVKDVIGAHPQRARLVVDELQACSKAALVIRDNLGASGEYKEVFMGNPDNWSNALGDASDPYDIDRGETQNRSVVDWSSKRISEGKRTKVVVLDGRDSPSKDDPKRLFFMLKPGLIRDVEKKLERGEPLQRKDYTYLIGRIPPAGVTGTVLSEQEVESSKARRSVSWEGEYEEWVCGDPSSAVSERDGFPLIRLKVGREVGGKSVVEVSEVHNVVVDVNNKEKPVTQMVAEQVNEVLAKWGVPLDRLVNDNGGASSQINDAIETQAKTVGKIKRVKPQGPGSDRKLYDQPPHKPRDRYRDRATELIMNLATGVSSGRVAGMTDAIIEQLTSREFMNDGNALLKTELKKMWKDRHAGDSPNDMDALACGFDYLLEVGKVSLSSQSVESVIEVSSEVQEVKKAIDFGFKMRNLRQKIVSGPKYGRKYW